MVTLTEQGRTWITPDEQLSFKTTKLDAGFGLHRMNNCRFKRQNMLLGYFRSDSELSF